MWACKRLDLCWADWALALRCCGAPPAWSATAERIARLWSPAGDALVCLGVRSAFDLYLRTRRWKPGDEIVFSALTVPDMPEIARRHGLRAVPLDVDPATAVWRPEDLEKAIGPRTRALVLAHLFGTARGCDRCAGSCASARRRRHRGLRPSLRGPRLERASGHRPRALLLRLDEDRDRPRGRPRARTGTFHPRGNGTPARLRSRAADRGVLPPCADGGRPEVGQRPAGVRRADGAAGSPAARS